MKPLEENFPCCCLGLLGICFKLVSGGIDQGILLVFKLFLQSVEHADRCLSFCNRFVDVVHLKYKL